MKFIFYFIVFIFIFKSFDFVYAQKIIKHQDSMPSVIYFDADGDIKINKETGYIELNNNASFLIGKTYISAHKIVIFKNENLITAEGNVKLIYDNEKAIASKLVLDLNTKQIRMDNATIFADPASTDDELSKKVLGLSKAEIAFDKDRFARTSEIENQLKSIRDPFTNLKNLKEIRKNDKDLDEKINLIVIRYGQLLARYSRTKYQPNVYLAAIPEIEKERFLKRREAVQKFSQENPDIAGQIVNFTVLPSYVYLSASQIIQKDKHSFILNSAIITSCHCSSLGEPAIYAFSAQNAKIDVGNYVTLQGATFDIFSMPLFYAPWLKLSIKNKRETGFLYYSGYTSNNAGSASSVPFFITLGDHADDTITYRYFTLRGSLFENELRGQLNQETPLDNNSTQFYSLNSYIQDNKYSSDYLINKNKIDSIKVTNPALAAQNNNYQDYLGNNITNRWSTQESFSLLLNNYMALKANAQFVSDNTFLSNFSTSSIADPTSAVLGDTTVSSNRFLAQEVDLEYFGENSILSIRTQGQRDLFSQTQTNTPMRLPRVEFTLLPSRYFNSPVAFSLISTWETVFRPQGGQNYITPSNTTIINNQKNSLQPYVEGKRFFLSSSASLPLPANNYVNAYAKAKANGVQYYFPAADPYGKQQPYQGYMEYSLHVSAPIYARHDLYDEENQLAGNISHTINPFVDMSYIPNVKQGYHFPYTYNQWYLQDSMTDGGNPVASSAYFTVGISSSWNIRKRKFVQKENLIDRFLTRPNPMVANISNLSKIIQEKKLSLKSDPNAIFQFSSDADANEIFKAWAQKELNEYYKLVLYDEFNQKYQWPNQSYFELSNDLEMSPLSIAVSTNYNFLAKKTAQEININAGPLIPQVPETPFGDIAGSLNWNLNPIIRLDGSVSTHYSQVYNRLVDLSATTNTNLYHVGLSYNHAIQYAQYIPIANPNSNYFIEKTQDNLGVSYLPKEWVEFGFKWSYSVDPSAQSVDTSDGRGYGSSYYVNLTNFQDCLDLVFARNKPPGVPEKQATYLIEFNLKIFGSGVGKQDVGNYLNRKIQESNS